MNDGLAKAYDLHSEIAKQPITLATATLVGIVGVSTLDRGVVVLTSGAYGGLALLLASTAFGILHLGALSRAAEAARSLRTAGAVLWTARLQQIAFVVAVGVIAVTLGGPAPQAADPSPAPAAAAPVGPADPVDPPG